MDIRCRKTDCKYNDHLTCTAQKLNISKQFKCEEYIKEGGKGSDYSKLMFERVPQFCKYKHNKKMPLNCCAKCLFNQEGHCRSNGITINDINDVPKCVNFIKP